MGQANQRFFWIAVIGLLLLTRIPASADYLSIDNVNLAFSLERFDPRIHQPHPPGYPLFVAFARLINVVFRDAETTFLWCSLLASGLSLFLVWALGKQMFSEWAARAAVLLLLVNPVFWFSGLEGPLRPFLAVFSLASAYCAWRSIHGEPKFVLWGAATLGVGGGFRPELLLFLFPLWLVSALVGTRSWRRVLQGCGVIGAIVLVWTSALVIASGGAEPYWRLMAEYTVEQSRVESLVLGADEPMWLRQFLRLSVWNGLAVAGWVWAAPLFLWSRTRALMGKRSAFLMLWLLPGLSAHALVHVAAPGHTLFSTPALCLIGGHVLASVGAAVQSREAALSAALVLNMLPFLNFFQPTVVPQPAGTWQLMRNTAAQSLLESSVAHIRGMDDIARLTLQEIDAYTPQGAPTVIVSTDVVYQKWFLNWRIVRFYSDRDIWVVADHKTPPLAQRIRRSNVLETRTGEVVRVPIPAGGRVLWLLEHYNKFHNELAKAVTLQTGYYMFYSDIPRDAAPFRVLNFEFVPATPVPES